jgi:uncharacterized lipoprotein NlpE involved in copper resistance
MKNILILILILGLTFVVVGCGTDSDTQIVADSSNSPVTGLDYAGTYYGTTPCADCDGVETEIQILDSGEYIKTEVYKGKSERKYVSSGDFDWDSSRLVVTLEGQIGPDEYLVSNDTLTELDENGKVITGPLAETYVFRK